MYFNFAMTPTRNPQAQLARSVFFEDVNEIDVFVEDTRKGSKKFYNIIFSRALEECYQISNVLPLGGREAVISQCQNDKNLRNRTRLYVVDGDLDLLLDSETLYEGPLLRLERYSIENYLIDEPAVLSILDEEDIDRDASQLSSEFQFEHWSDQIKEHVFPIFSVYALAHSFSMGVNTVSYPVRKLATADHDGNVEPSHCHARYHEILKIAKDSHDEAVISEALKAIESKPKRQDKNPLIFISGKDYLLPLLFDRMRATVKIKAFNDVLLQRLARLCDVTDLAASARTVLARERR